MLVATLLGILSLLIWTYLVLLHGRFWRTSRWVVHEQEGEALAPVRVAVVIPARNEADVVGRCVSSLLAQSRSLDLHVFLVDDESNDGTAEVARSAAQQAARSDVLTIITGSSRPSGWSGKLWAVQQGIGAAQAFHPAFLLLTDADVVHAPGSLASLVAIAQSGGYGLTSLMVRLHCAGFSEKLLIPAFVYFFFLLYPPAWIRDPKRRTAGAAGGCMLVRPESLERAGGIAAIRSEIIDDCALARAIKSSGGPVWLGLADATASVRPYRSWSEIERMISRTAFNQLRHSALLLFGALIGMCATYLLPLALLFTFRPWPAGLGAFVWALMAISYLPMVRHYRVHPLGSLALPAAACFYMIATLHSALKYWKGRGGEWKGRVQDARLDAAVPKDSMNDGDAG